MQEILNTMKSLSIKVWNTQKNKWIQWKRGYSIGRIYTTNPSQGE